MIIRILILCLLPTLLYAGEIVWEQEELAALNRLIDRTTHQLEQQLRLKEQFLKFEESQQIAMADPEDRKAMSRMVANGAHLLEAAQEAHLTYLFTAEFLEELQSYYRIFYRGNLRAASPS